jgi:hypothetical protein
MSTLNIKDLPKTEELNADEMAAVSGGTASCGTPSCLPPGWTPFVNSPTDIAFNASQMLGQTQNVMNNNGNNVAFANGISSTVNPTQTGSNNIKIG